MVDYNTLYEDSNNLYRFNNASLRRWGAAVANVRAGVSDTSVMCIGDSVTYGAIVPSVPFSTFTSYPSFLATLFNDQLAPSAPGLTIPSNFASIPNGQWVPTGTWVNTPANTTGMGGNSFWRATGTHTGSLVFSDTRVVADTYDVHYLQNTTNAATLNAVATGGTPGVVATLGAAPGWNVLTITAAAALSTNNVTITATLTGDVYILGVVPRLSATPKILIHNAGVGSSSAEDHLLLPTGGGTISAMRRILPSLTIISLGINDAIESQSVARYTSAIRQLIDVGKESGDVILMSSIPATGTATAIDLQRNYQAALASMFSISYADWAGRLGGNANASSLGFLSTDLIHGTAQCYSDCAHFLFNALRDI